jgi:uncharacterized protein (TIGR03086 family)
MEGVSLFRRALQQATALVEVVDASQFSRPTPCTEWDVRALVGHMLYELAWVPDLIRGATIAEVGDRYDGDLIGADLAASWQRAANAALAVVEDCDPNGTAHLSIADVTNDSYLQQVGGDELIHSWDLGVATGAAPLFDPELVEAVYQNTLPGVEGMQATGLFAPPVPVPEDADVQTRLVAIFGRDPAWQPPR